MSPIPANDIGARKREVEDLIAFGKVAQATKRLMDFVRDFATDKQYLKEVIVMSSSYHRLERKERMNVIKADDIEISRNRLLLSMLELMDALQDELALTLDLA